MDMTPPPPRPPEPQPLLKLAIDFLPLAVFFAVNALAPGPKMDRIFLATAAFMLATAAAMLLSKMKTGRISPMLWFSGAMVLGLGGLTLWLHDDTFIKVKPTIYYSMLALILFGGLATGRPTLEVALGAAYPGLSAVGWRILTRNWAVFFVGMAVANELVRRHFSTEFWIGYKLWGALPATVLFALANMPVMVKHGMTFGEAERQEPPPQG